MKIKHERILAAVLFVVAFVVFFLAKEDTKKLEQLQRDAGLSQAASSAPASQVE